MTEAPVAGPQPTQGTASGAAAGGIVPSTLNPALPGAQVVPAAQQGQQGQQPLYPANTSVEQMTAPQQAAYWRDLARKHEKAWQGKVGRELTPEIYESQLAELEKLRGEVGTETERQVSQARKEERAAVAAEYGPKLVRAALGAHLAAMAEADRTELMDSINPSAFLTPQGDVDTAKVQTFVTKFVQATGTVTGGHVADHGAGKRSTTMLSPREAGLAEARRRFGDKVAAAK